MKPLYTCTAFALLLAATTHAATVSDVIVDDTGALIAPDAETFREQNDIPAESDQGDLAELDTITLNLVTDSGALAALDDITLSLVTDAGNLASMDDITLSLVTDAGDAAALDVGTTAGTVAAGDDSRIVNAVQPADLSTYLDQDVGAGTSLTLQPQGSADDISLILRPKGDDSIRLRSENNDYEIIFNSNTGLTFTDSALDNRVVISSSAAYVTVIDGTQSVDWRARQSYDSSGDLAIDWDGRQFTDDMEDVTLDWQDRELLGGWSHEGMLTLDAETSQSDPLLKLRDESGSIVLSITPGGALLASSLGTLGDETLFLDAASLVSDAATLTLPADANIIDWDSDGAGGDVTITAVDGAEGARSVWWLINTDSTNSIIFDHDDGDIDCRGGSDITLPPGESCTIVRTSPTTISVH